MLISSWIKNLCRAPNSHSHAAQSKPRIRRDVSRQSIEALESRRLLTQAVSPTADSEKFVIAVTDGSDFDQWYYSNQDSIHAAWSNAMSGLDLNDSTVDWTVALSALWDETLSKLYGAGLPWASETVVETEVMVTEDTVLVEPIVCNFVVEDVRRSFTDAEITADSETVVITVTDSSDFDQWYYSNLDAIQAAWSNAILGLDLNDNTMDRTVVPSVVWNETLRNLYGADLPWTSETVVETGIVRTRNELPQRQPEQPVFVHSLQPLVRPEVGVGELDTTVLLNLTEIMLT